MQKHQTTTRGLARKNNASKSVHPFESYEASDRHTDRH